MPGHPKLTPYAGSAHKFEQCAHVHNALFVPIEAADSTLLKFILVIHQLYDHPICARHIRPSPRRAQEVPE